MTRLDRPSAALAAGAVVLTVGAFVPVSAVRALVVVVAALVVPGAALLLGLGVGRGRLDPVPTLALGVMMSLAFYPLAALVLYVIGVRMSRGSLVVAVDVLVAAMILLDARRRARQTAEPRPLLAAVAEPPGEARRWGRWLGAVVLCCAGVLALGARFLPSAPPAPFNELAFTGPMAKLDGPLSIADGSVLSVPVSVRNASARPQHYVLVARLDGQAFTSDRPLLLAPGATWSGSVTGRVDPPGCLNKLVVDLVPRPGASSVASVDLWIRIRASGCAG